MNVSQPLWPLGYFFFRSSLVFLKVFPLYFILKVVCWHGFLSFHFRPLFFFPSSLLPDWVHLFLISLHSREHVWSVSLSFVGLLWYLPPMPKYHKPMLLLLVLWTFVWENCLQLEFLKFSLDTPGVQLLYLIMPAKLHYQAQKENTT